MPRLLELFREFGVAGTFYIPGTVALRHPGLVHEIVAEGHEIGLHGHRHVAPASLPPDAQLDELERGSDAVRSCAEADVVGYRAPGWELSPVTLEALPRFGYRYDSSCMADDRPYSLNAGAATVLEIPVHWSLDDWPYFLFTRKRPNTFVSPTAMVDAWRAEFRAARREGRHVTFTLHPECSGRAYRTAMLRDLMAETVEARDMPALTHGQVAIAVLDVPA
jgi:peptidoglycan/xylan/chitin deacetylase (PgdA/CDA1 family)